MPWLDANSLSGLAGPQSIQGSSAFDANNPLAYYQNQSNNPFTYKFQDARSWMQGGGDSQDPTMYNDPAYILSSNGRRLDLSPDNTFVDTFDRPGGKGEKEKVDVTYKYDPATGQVTPVNAAERFQGSDWANTFRPILQSLAPVLTAGIGGAYGAGALGGAEAGGVAAGNGAFLGEGVASGIPAWDAAYTGAGGAFGGGAGGGLENFGNQYSMDFTPDASTGGADSAYTGSDAHFYQDTGIGTGLQDLGNMGGGASTLGG